MPGHLRIIDANANRAREALRVMEDAARFVLDDAGLCSEIKSLRHDLAESLAGAGTPIAWRDTPADVGTSISTPGERSRGSIRDVVIAACKRLSEALRSVEEYTKITGPRIAPRIESLRYRGYECERRLVMAMGASRRPAWRLCVILTESLCTHRPWLDVARLAIEGGADCLQLREKSLDSRELLDRARSLVRLARAVSGPGTTSVIINDRPDIALLAGADGVHLGQSDLSVPDARRIVGFDLLVGVSTENLDQARAALHVGADDCGAGPMFPTDTKHKPCVAGPGYLREYLSHDPPLPHVLAIGGVTTRNATALRDAAAPRPLGDRWGIAVSSAVCGSPDPASACRSLLG